MGARRGTWLEEHDNTKRLDGVLAKAIKRMKNRLMAAGFDMWVEKLAWVKKKQKIINMWKSPMLAKGFYGCVPPPPPRFEAVGVQRVGQPSAGACGIDGECQNEPFRTV